jgi:uncharacterized membrane protein YhaH (DUF805 family)
MTFKESIKTCFNKYATFNGRASRSEYWFWTLFLIVAELVIWFGALMLFGGMGASVGGAADPYGAAGGALGGMIVGGGIAMILIFIFALIIILPTLAVTVRRLHDSNKSGWFLLLYIVPFVGPLVIFVFMLLPSTEGANNFGS